MTIAVDMGRKATKQTNKQNPKWITAKFVLNTTYISIDLNLKPK